MAQLSRTWLGLAALGAGLIHLAVAAGSTPVLLVPFALIGAAELGWGVLALARPRLMRPRAGAAIAVVPIVLWLVLLLVGGGGMTGMRGMPRGASSVAVPAGAMLGASALDLLLVVGLALVTRRPAADRTSAAHVEPERPWRFLGGVVVGAGIVAVVTANSLAATPIGAGAMPGMSH